MITSLGEALFDIVPISSPDNRIDRTLTLLQAGGAPFNVAVTLARLGNDVRFCGALSTDALGQRLRAILEQHGVDVVPTDPVDALTRVAIVTPDDEQNTFTFYGNAPADTQLELDIVGPALEQCTGLYISSMMMLDAHSRTVQSAILDAACRKGVPIFFDPNPRPSLWSSTPELMSILADVLKVTSLVKLSRTDLDILNIRGDLEQQFAALARMTRAAIVITDGERGCWSIFGDEVIHAQVPPLETLDPTGAGDVFMAALISEYQDRSRLDATGLRFAAAAGALSASRQGAATAAPTRAEIEEFLGRS